MLLGFGLELALQERVLCLILLMVNDPGSGGSGSGTRIVISFLASSASRFALFAAARSKRSVFARCFRAAREALDASVFIISSTVRIGVRPTGTLDTIRVRAATRGRGTGVYGRVWERC